MSLSLVWTVLGDIRDEEASGLPVLVTSNSALRLWRTWAVGRWLWMVAGLLGATKTAKKIISLHADFNLEAQWCVLIPGLL